MKPVSIVIVDDEKRIRSSLINQLKLHYVDAQVVGEADNVEKAIEVIKKNDPDIVLLDIKMPGASGFDLLNRIKPHTFKIIFITAFNNHAIEAFKFSAVDYLLKPVIAEDLVKALDRACDQMASRTAQEKMDVLIENLQALNRDGRKLILNTNDKMHVVSSNEIIRCESSGNYTLFTLNNKTTILVSKQIGEYEDLLVPHGFFRPHNSHLVNLSQVDRFEKKESILVMKDGSKTPVASRKLADLMTVLGNL